MNGSGAACGLICVLAVCGADAAEGPLPPITVSEDGKHFVAEGGKRFVVWGVNYDHDRDGRLLDEYWDSDWNEVAADFAEIKKLGANCVRIHLQIGKFLETPNKANPVALRHLKRLVNLAEETRLYLNITGLACYHKQNIPAWFDELSESDRWAAQAQFWQSVAATCSESPAIFCYDLMNEPILPGKQPETEWLAGELGGKHFVQRLALDARGRTRQQIASDWVKQMTDAIRQHDKQHMITVGVIPWVFVFGGGKPLFHSPPVNKHLDFVAVHFYPKKGEVDKALKALRAYEVGKPLLIEEMFPLKCSQEELTEFIQGGADFVDGWTSFYWGATAEELRAKQPATIGDAIVANWLDKFSDLSRTIIKP